MSLQQQASFYAKASLEGKPKLLRRYQRSEEMSPSRPINTHINFSLQLARPLVD